MTFTYKGIDVNLRFLILEVKKQLEITRQALEKPHEICEEKITSSGSYVDNLKNIITKKSYSQILLANDNDKTIIDAMMAINTISSNLEKIGDYCESIIHKIDDFHDKNFIKNYKYGDFFGIILEAFAKISDSLFKGDIPSALKICQAELKVDEVYHNLFCTLMNDLDLKGKECHGDIITSLLIFMYLERAGDALLNIGESIISMVVGSRLKIYQYIALKKSCNGDDIQIESIEQETRSGCRIERLHKSGCSKNHTDVIFKGGNFRKILSEKHNLEKWQSLFPKLIPKIYSFEQQGENASILMECIEGENFQQILQTKNTNLINDALENIFKTFHNIWDETMTKEKSNAKFMKQLSNKLSDVYNVHPYFIPNPKKTKQIGNIQKLSFKELLDSAKNIEEQLYSPFSVLIHGDFNNDNVIFNSKNKQIYCIDIHRSKSSDYVQDISVFMVSNFRITEDDLALRNIINDVTKKIYWFAKNYADKHGDKTFDARLSLGLVRSFMSSTRFALNKAFAKNMYYRSIYLLERLNGHKGTWENFKLGNKVIYS